MTWTAPTRNFDRIQFESLRKVVDGKFNEVHDELSDCYYNKKPFRTFGVLDKETFDKLHGLIFLQRDVAFHEANLALAAKDQIPVEKYNVTTDELGATVSKTDEAAAKIADLKAEGLELKT